VGKTTLARQLLAERPDAVYLDLEAAADRRRMDDPRAFLATIPGQLTILDEVHLLPTLFAELRGEIDERRRQGHRSGQFLLLGSASLDLIQTASETLAGRVRYLEIAPLTAPEVAPVGIPENRLWLRGGFPDSLLAPSDAASLRWRSAFIRSYLERDVPMFAPRVPASAVGQLWTMLAHAQGTMLNLARLAQALAVSAPTVQRYVGLLEDLLLVRRLLPWSGDLAKRLIRTPKLYIRDSGLLHGLLELESLHDLLGHPVVGASWEGFVIETLIAAAGPGMRPLYYRTQDGAEIDLAFERGGKPELAIEIKRSSAPKIEPGFAIACNDLGVTNRLCIAPVEASYPTRGGVMVMPLLEAVARLKQRG
jgi:predicted AAA+ superfamily ATPase